MSVEPIFEHRFGISLLSKSSNNKAYNEEVLIDKKTGELLIKTADGDTISYDYSSRREDAINEFRTIADRKGLYGDMYELNMTFSDGATPPHYTPLPHAFITSETDAGNTTESINCAINTGASHLYISHKRAMLYLDLHSFAYTEESSDTFTNETIYPKVTITLTVTFSDNTTENVTITDYVYNINEKIYELTNSTLDSGKYITIITINNLTIFKDDFKNRFGEAVSTTGKKVRNILYNFFILFESEDY